MQSDEQSWKSYNEHLHASLTGLKATDIAGNILDTDAAFAQWREYTLVIRNASRDVYLCGNGASASMASHCAADLAKNGGVRTHVFTDMSLISAIGNDTNYDMVFALPLDRYMRDKDMLVAISSSGSSPNILKAVATARAKGGFCVTLSGFKPDNTLRRLGDLNFYLSVPTYGLAESGHAALLHFWIDAITSMTTGQQP